MGDNLTTDGLVTLREALLAAQTDKSVDGSVAGLGADIINFADGLTGSIGLSIIGSSTNGPSALEITTPVTINGFNGGLGITIERSDSAPGLRLFEVSPTGNLTLVGLTLANGLAEGVAGKDGLGGAILNNGGILSVAQSLLTENSALGGLGGGDGLGGAIFNDLGKTTLTNTTVFLNKALGDVLGDSLGGGIANRNGLLEIISSTLSANTAPDGGQNVLNLGDGLLSVGTTLLNNSILGQSGPADVTDFLSKTVDGALLGVSSGLGNLIRNPGNFLGGVVSTVDPLLGPLADNGGPTLSLLPGLPALGTGVSSLLNGLLTDQTGLVPRLLGGLLDIGAIQVGAGAVSSVTSTTPNGTYGVGATINVTVNFNQPVTLTGGNLIVNLSSGGTVTIAPFANATTASGTYTIAAGQNVADLDSTSINLASGAALKDTNDNNVSLAIPLGRSLADSKSITVNTNATAPAVSSVTSTTPDGTYGVGAEINVTINFTQAVTLAGGNLTVNLDSGGTVVIAPFANATSASGTYTVAAGQNSTDLNSIGIILGAGATLKDASNTDASLAIPAGQSLANLEAIVVNTSVTNAAVSSVTSTTPDGAYGVGSTINVTVNFSQPVTLAGGNLTVNLDSGGTVVITPFANATSASGTYTVADGQNSADLNSTGLVLGAGATLKDATDNNVSLAIPAGQSLADLKAIVVDTDDGDTTAPTVTIAPGSTATGHGPVVFTITYSDENFSKSTLTAADVTLNKTGNATGTVSVVAGSGATRTVIVSDINGNGTLGISIVAGTAEDVAGNEAAAAGPSATIAVTNIPIFAIGGDDGTVRILNADTGAAISTIRPLDVVGGSAYAGLVQVALGDLNRDGAPDLFVTAANPVGVDGLDPGKAGKVFVFDGAELSKGGTPAAFRAITPFTTHSGPDGETRAYINGLNIAVGDVNGDGFVDLVAGTRGGSAVAGDAEYGRLAVVSGASAPGVDTLIGSVITPFGPTYQKGVVVAVGDLDGTFNAAGMLQAEIAVTRGGPVAASNPNKSVKLKAYSANGAAIGELNLSGTSTPLAPFVGITGPDGEVLARDARVAFTDQNGDGKDELVMSILDPFTAPGNTQVRITAFSVNTSTGLATPISTGTGPSNSYVVGSGIVDHAITHVDLNGDGSTDLALVTESSTSGVMYLNPLTGATVPGGLSLTIINGGISIDGI